MDHVLAGVLAITVFAGLVESECPNGWVTYETSCYFFGHNQLSFNEAEEQCIHDGAHLVSIETSDESLFLKSFLSDLKDSSYWIGLTDHALEGIWEWIGTHQKATFTDWNPQANEPNGGKAENCVYIYPGVAYRWVDIPCGNHYKPICKRSTDSGSSIVG